MKAPTSSAGRRFDTLPGIAPESYVRHMLHGDERIWLEKNCYVDVWIEALHSLQLEPLAIAPFVLAMDFEGDQWTFFKPPHDELRSLYGVDVQELNVWRPLIEHAAEHLSAGKMISTEADAYWMPDTAGTDYRRQHTKSTIVLAEIDLDAGTASYFHNAGYYRLEGEDYRKTFRLDAEPDAGFLPLFAETVRFDRIVHRPADELATMSFDLLRKHLARRPLGNPVERFARRFAADIPVLQERGIGYYHSWAFGTIRQLGAAFEFAALHLRWLGGLGYLNLQDAVEAFELIASTNKTLILKAARATASRKPFDASATFADMAAAWETGMQALDRGVLSR